MMTTAQDPTLFIGSSSEGLEVAEYLQAVLDEHCEASVWNQGAFGLSGTGIESLVQAARAFDFAVLVLTADDLVTKRGTERPAARDNVLFEAGLFIGAIGLERTFLVVCRDDGIGLPSDLAGVTVATYKRRADGRLRPALSPVGLEIRERMSHLGLRQGARMAVATAVFSPTGSLEDESTLLEQELDSLSTSAEAQGWHVKTRSATAFRLVAPDRTRFSLAIGDPSTTRIALRDYAREVNEYGLRFSRALLTPVNETPPTPATRAKEPAKARTQAPQRAVSARHPSKSG